ncbi:MAG TPA: hypothetical protein GYA06_12130 [Chloroflexi bacterium]|nr:hypothetical protein [Chloroflexota bacterium]
MNNRFWISAILLLAIFCLTAGVCSVLGGLVFLSPGGLLDRSQLEEMIPDQLSTLEATVAGRPSGPRPVTTPIPQRLPTMPVRTEPADPAGTAAPAEEEGLSSDVLRGMDEIQEVMEQLRGLELQEPPARDVLTPEELRQVVIDDFLADYTPEEMAQDQQILEVFGLLEPDYDLYDLYVNLLSEQVAGFYDDETRQMYVVQGEAFEGPERMTYAHEFVHALQDQHFGLRDGLGITEENCEQDSEYCAAVQAVVEGDASLAEQIWLFEHSSPRDRQEILEFYQGYSSPVFDSAPEFLRLDFLFPYDQGLSFVQSFYERGGWDGVNRLYEIPPMTTEQIMHPERYPDDIPVAVVLPDLLPVLGDGWTELDNNILGEWYTYLVLGAGAQPGWRLSESAAARGAEGWGGDRYLVYGSESGETVLVLSTVWDSVDESEEFWTALTGYGRRRWGQPDTSGTASGAGAGEYAGWSNTADGTVLVWLSGDTTLWVIAPDEETALRLSDQILN